MIHGDWLRVAGGDGKGAFVILAGERPYRSVGAGPMYSLRPTREFAVYPSKLSKVFRIALWVRWSEPLHPFARWNIVPCLGNYPNPTHAKHLLMPHIIYQNGG
jgi:hypothetical protein